MISLRFISSSSVGGGGLLLGASKQSNKICKSLGRPLDDVSVFVSLFFFFTLTTRCFGPSSLKYRCWDGDGDDDVNDDDEETIIDVVDR
jgi:hypothetical protein